MAEFSFLVVSDLHFIDDNCRPFFQRMVAKMKAFDAAFLAVLGDVGEVGTRAEFAAIREILDSTGLPLHVVCGNHDWTNDWDRSLFLEYFPGPTNYVFEHGRWQFVAMDSSVGRAWKDTAVPEASLAWLDETLPTLDRDRPTVLLTHFPLGDGVKYQVNNANAVLDRFRDHNLRHVFNGHYHGHTDLKPGKYGISTSGCCSFAREMHDGTKARGFVVCDVNEEDLVRRFIEVPTETAQK